METRIEAEAALNTYKAIRKRFYDAADTVFGPGFLSMTEYYFMKKKGYNPFAMLFSEPRIVYDEWVAMFKGEACKKTCRESCRPRLCETSRGHQKKRWPESLELASENVRQGTPGSLANGFTGLSLPFLLSCRPLVLPRHRSPVPE